MDYFKQQKGFITSYQLELWKSAKYGIISFCLLHFIFELGTGNSKALIAVVINYFVSAYIIKDRIKKGKITKNSYIWGIVVSCLVFLVRLLIGFLIVKNYV